MHCHILNLHLFLICQVHYEKKHALEARLRPEDKYCKPALARCVPVTNIVLRVRRRRHKGVRDGGRVGVMEEEEGQDGKSGPECQVEVLGLVKTNFEFTGTYNGQSLLLRQLCNNYGS